MSRPHLPLNALRAFEASARHLSFTRAGLELRVTQTAISHQVKSLETILDVRLFRRLPRGLALTDEGQVLLPVLVDAFDRIVSALDRFEHKRVCEVITVGTVGTFATGWLLPRLDIFRQDHPFVDLRVLTNNNRVDLAGDGLDYAIRFGTGAWHGTEATHLLEAPLSPACLPALAEQLRAPADLLRQRLLRSYRDDEWPQWFASAGLSAPVIRGPVLDSSVILAEAVSMGIGVALLPRCMFARARRDGRLVWPFDTQINVGSYWLTHLQSRPITPGMQAFRDWLRRSIRADHTAQSSGNSTATS
ncbi:MULTISPECIES: LysR family transcriptional regulator [Rhodopseudomonas]|uniref:LysR family transcriptional regulator n=1 Tax=Rhodopseudomonas TaxID=1073 RepID=UPI0005C80A48|nr:MULTISPECIES: LysR family transcriptional regulator [Rhodopseudomonas]MDF3812662.1 LysR family transcriptional regulator [Rhodopseudomonas sp. BAL398]WOK18927.1 LysR family transcriptional regulator [Rhodopseudomonas sp. BAL398]